MAPTFVPIELDSQSASIASRLNWLRAGVLGANDGIVSTAGMIFGVAGAAVSDRTILIAGVAAVSAGALSMAVGEYVSVSSQKDSEKAEIETERRQLAADPEYGLKQLTGLVTAQGIDPELARQVAVQLTAKDALTAHARLELGIDPDALTNPWHAGLSSMIAFTLGGLVPLIAFFVSPHSIEVTVTAFAVVVALAATGSVSASLGRASMVRAALRTVAGGLLAMGISYAIGATIGVRL
jgi:VIT1/CCC1 family predicted Fe2+/Mn2+ transporter